MKNNIYCAIDTVDIDRAIKWVNSIKPYTSCIKLGMEFFYAHGHKGVNDLLSFVEGDSSLFIDLKFHDIPNTVAGAVRSILPLKPDYFTVHAAGGLEMISSAVNESNESKVLAVTVLTSMDNKDLTSSGINNKVIDQVCIYADLALNAGVDGFVCSPHEISILRKEFGDDFVLMVPGIRPADNPIKSDDQNRVMTPVDAVKLGANHLVIGRPITNSSDVAAAAKNICDSILSIAI